MKVLFIRQEKLQQQQQQQKNETGKRIESECKRVDLMKKRYDEKINKRKSLECKNTKKRSKYRKSRSVK